MVEINPYELGALPPDQREAAAKKVSTPKLKEVAENEKAQHTSRMVAQAELARRDERKKYFNWFALFVAVAGSLATILGLFKKS